MWNEQGNTMAPGQMMGYDLARSDASMHMKNVNNQFLGSSLNDLYADEETRKRKAEVLNGNNILRDAPLSLQAVNQIVTPAGSFVPAPVVFNQNLGVSQFGHVQNDGVFSQISQLSHENMPISQAGVSSQYSINAYSASSQALDFNSQKSTAGNSMAPNFPSREPSSTSTAAVIEIPRLPYSQHFTYKVVGQTEVNNSQSATNNAGNSGNLQGNFVSRGESNAQIPAHIFGGNMPLNSSALSSKESTQPRGLTPEIIAENASIDTKIDTQGLTSTVHSASNNLLDFARSLNALLHQNNLIVGSVGAAEKGETCASSKNEIKLISDLSARMPADACQQDSTRSGCASISAESQVIPGTINNLPVKTDNQVSLSNMGIQRCHGAKDETSHNILDGHISLPTVQIGPLNAQPKSILDGESNATNGLSTLASTGKIWDGTIQLNTSTTVSAVAFFKSGEKSLDINWPHFIEVKGKVRLEAFEKFIQELPRSRSRTLMVTSICWKSGTSETGLTGIKEVSKGYKDGQRVGFAHLGPGTDLYVCPRSETIITILAKYGFFKGMAAVEEDQDSLIGCVVWRRNLNPNAVSKETDPKKPPLEKTANSPSDSNLQTTGTNSTSSETKDSENKLTIMPKIDPTIALVAQVSAIPVSRESGSASSAHIAPSSMISPTTGANIAAVSVDSTKFLQSITAVPSQLSSNNYFVSPLQTCTGQIPCTGAPISSSTAPAKPHGDANDRHAAFDGTVQLPHGAQTGSRCTDDDDLPEFDFDTACGALISGSHGPWFNHQGNVSAGQGVKRPPPGDSGTLTNPVMKSDVPSMQAPFPAVPAYIHQGTQPHLKVAADSLEKRGTVQTIETLHNVAISRENEASVKQQANAPKRALWDDDDMPEWCPPDLDHAQQPQPQALPPPPLPPPSLPHQLPEFDRQPRMLPPPPPPRPSSVTTHSFPSSINHQPSDVFSRAPFIHNAAEHNRVLGREPTSHSTSLPPQIPSSAARFQFEKGHSPVRNYATERNRLIPGREPTSHSASLPTQLPSSISRFQFEQGHLPGHNYATEQIRGAPGQEPTSHRPSLPTQLPSSTARFQFERRHSPGRNLNNSPGHLRSRFDMKHENRPLEVNYNGTSRRQHIDYEHQELSPRSKPRETSRRRRTGFDVLPDNTRLASPRTTRRRPSLFDVKPDSHHLGGMH